MISQPHVFPVWMFHLAGAVQIGILAASAMVPSKLEWKSTLSVLPEMHRRLFWVYGAFIVLTILGFGVLTLLFAARFAEGTSLARGLAGLIAIFWGTRLAVQFLVFDVRPWLTHLLYRVGYHLLTVAFLFLTVIYGLRVFL